ncbi:MAG: polyamine aminopropyltransferase [Thermodesulforhabdaceae bacterium]
MIIRLIGEKFSGIFSHNARVVSASKIIKLAVFVTGFSGILIEYIISTIASYLLGDTLFQWALIISLFLFAMGIGSRITGYIKSDEAICFVVVESLLSLVIVVSLTGAYASMAYPVAVRFVLYGSTLLVGILIGMEIPLLIRLNSRFADLALNLSRLLEKDYIGALVGGIFFAFIGLSRFGPLTLGILVALLNWLVALIFWLYFGHQIAKGRAVAVIICFVGVLTCAALPFGNAVASWGEDRKYRDEIIYSEQTPYQKIVITRWRQFFWLYLDGHLQFSSYDEYRYHESLVHPAMLASASRENVLILGGGDGLAAREVLKYRDVKNVTLVDIDPAITNLARTHPLLVDLNDMSLKDPRVRVINDDAGAFLDRSPQIWDVIIIDLPDPRTPTLERLYSVEFYRNCKRHLSRGGVMVTQATSPVFSPYAFWCIVKTMEEAGFYAVPMHAYVPTFGDWGWVIGSDFPEEILRSRIESHWDYVTFSVKFLSLEVLKTLFIFSPADKIDFQKVEKNSFLKPVLYQYYRQGLWGLE